MSEETRQAMCVCGHSDLNHAHLPFVMGDGQWSYCGFPGCECNAYLAVKTERQAMIEAAKRADTEWLDNGDDLRDFYEVLTDFALKMTRQLHDQLAEAIRQRDAAVEALERAAKRSCECGHLPIGAWCASCVAEQALAAIKNNA